MRLMQAFLLITMVYITAFVLHAAHLQKTVYGDGVFYYSWLRSIVVDRDIDFTNEYSESGVTQPLNQRGTPGNKYSIGPALVWAPGFLLTHIIVRGNGWELPYQITTGMTGVLLTLFGLILLARVIRGSPLVQGTVILLIAGATNLFFYGALDTVNSHALSFFAATLFLAFLTHPRKLSFWIGVSLALLAMIRLQDIVYFLALIPFIKRVDWKLIAVGFLVGFLPQLAAWLALYGSLANPYLTGGETFDILHPHIWGVLFGAQSGLFLWTPITAVGVIGLILSARQRSSRAILTSYLYIFLAELLIVASWSTWSQGASFSGRMFVSSIPLLAIGLTPVVSSLTRRRLLRNILPLLIAAISMVNAMAIFYFLFTS